MSERESLSRVSLLRYQYSVVKGNRSLYPLEFLEAVKKYADKRFVFRAELFEPLQKWREYAERNPESVPRFDFLGLLSGDYDNIEQFKNLILYAVFHGDKEFLKTLLETLPLTHSPEPDMHSVRAVIAAFCDLFKGGSKYDWPLKKQVRERAIEILKEAASPIPHTQPEWARIFRKAGLKDLPNAKRRSKHAKS